MDLRLKSITSGILASDGPCVQRIVLLSSMLPTHSRTGHAMPFDASPQRAPYRRPRLDIRDLHVVLAIAGARSTAKAATALHLSQSAVSRALLSTDADSALLTTTPVRGRLNEEPLFSDEIVFVAGASHPLATRSTITPADLRESVLITSATTPPAEAQWFYTRVFGRRIPKLH